MTSVFITAAVISITFFIAKFIEMRFIEKEAKPLKYLIRDSLIVYFSVLIASFILDQTKSLIQSGGAELPSAPVAFTGEPSF